jgi:hypothetical protein
LTSKIVESRLAENNTDKAKDLEFVPVHGKVYWALLIATNPKQPPDKGRPHIINKKPRPNIPGSLSPKLLGTYYLLHL